MLTKEHNARIHVFAAIFIVTFGFLFEISRIEWCLILFSIGLVFCMEIVNTSIENLADVVSPGLNEKIKKVKDLSAAAVLFAACTASIIGVIVFLPKIIVLCL